MITLGMLIMNLQMYGKNATYARMLYEIQTWLFNHTGDVEILRMTWNDFIHLRGYAPVYQVVGIEIGENQKIRVAFTGTRDDIETLRNILENLRE